MNSKCYNCDIIKNKEKFYNWGKKICIECFNYNYLKHEIALIKTAEYFNKSHKEIKLILNDLDHIEFNNTFIRFNININEVDINKLKEKIINNENYKEEYESLKKYNIKELFRLIRTTIYFEKSIYDIKNIIDEVINKKFSEKYDEIDNNNKKIYDWYSKSCPIDKLIYSI
tara:strand:- start:1419 stop:1931 length:513 start_codon:yes stop_codon:yes gene_type:complete